MLYNQNNNLLGSVKASCCRYIRMNGNLTWVCGPGLCPGGLEGDTTTSFDLGTWLSSNWVLLAIAGGIFYMVKK